MSSIKAQRTIDESTHFRVYGICKALVKRVVNRQCIHRFGVSLWMEVTRSGEVWVHRMDAMPNTAQPTREQITNVLRRRKLTDPTPQSRGTKGDLIMTTLIGVCDRILSGKSDPMDDAQLWGAAAMVLFNHLRASASGSPEVGDTDDSAGNGLDTLIGGENIRTLVERLDPKIWGIINPLAKGIKQSVIAQNEGVSQQAISKRLAAAAA